MDAHRCRVCGATPAAYTCSECENVFYCSPRHQATHWANIHHAQCPGAVPSQARRPPGGRAAAPASAGQTLTLPGPAPHGDAASDVGPAPAGSPTRRFRDHRDSCRERALAMLDDGNTRGALVAALESFRLTFGFHGGDHPDLVNDYLILGEVHGRFGLDMEAARCADAAMRIMTAHPQLFGMAAVAAVVAAPWGGGQQPSTGQQPTAPVHRSGRGMGMGLKWGGLWRMGWWSRVCMWRIRSVCGCVCM
jgi:hypothetical protein